MSGMNERDRGEQTLRLRADLLVEETDGEWVVFDLAGGSYMGLNHTGWLLWERLREEVAGVDALAQTLVESYEISRAQALDDAQTFSEQLVDAGLATWEGSDS
jgi:hypothetical protein